LWPSARSMAATVEESTPPDMATAIVCCVMNPMLLFLVSGFQFLVQTFRFDFGSVYDG
jgi:hypothetical protein